MYPVYKIMDKLVAWSVEVILPMNLLIPSKMPILGLCGRLRTENVQRIKYDTPICVGIFLNLNKTYTQHMQ